MNLKTNRWLLLAGGGVVAAGIAGTAFFSYQSWSADSRDGGPVAAGRGGSTVDDETLSALERRVQEQPTNADAHLELANAYLQKARDRGDPSLYSAAGNLLQKAQQLDPENPDVFATQGVLAGARHEFAESLALGQKALAIDPERARYWGVVADAQLQLGMYDEAVASLQEMVNRRPDFASYSRIAYARELYGDPEGAIEAMEFAIESGSSNQMDMAWAYVQAGNLYLNINNTTMAKAAYETALTRSEGYHGALAGQAKLAIAANDLPRAAELYEQAFAAAPLAEYAIALGAINKDRGDTEGAERQAALVRAIDQLSADNGVNTELDLVLFEIDQGTDSSESVKRARAAYEGQPSIHAADALAWALYNDGQVAEASKYAAEALKLGTRDPLKLFHAGVIAKAAGNTDAAFANIEEALRLNPNFSVSHRKQAAELLDELRQLARQPR